MEVEPPENWTAVIKQGNQKGRIDQEEDGRKELGGGVDADNNPHLKQENSPSGLDWWTTFQLHYPHQEQGDEAWHEQYVLLN